MEEKEENEVQAHKYRDVLSAKYGGDYNEENELDFVDKYVSESEADLGRFRLGESQMAEIMKGEPELATMMHEIGQGASPRVAFIKAFGAEGLEPFDGDEDYEANMTARKDRSDKADSMSALDAEMSKNEEESIANIDSYCEANGTDPNAFMEKINDIFDSILHRKVTPEMVEGLGKMFSYDTDVAEAKEVGEIEGRNTTIDATKAKKAKEKKGDGIPNGESSGASKDNDRDKFADGVRSMGLGKTDYSKYK